MSETPRTSGTEVTKPEPAPKPVEETKAKTPEAKEADKPQAPALTKLHLYGLAIVIGGILLALLIAIGKFDSERDTVTGVLGVVIPAFATIGAAMFGITVGYNAGESKGKATGEADGKEQGRAEGEAAKAEVAADSRQEVADNVKRLLPDRDASERVFSSLARSSPANTGQLRVDTPDTASEIPQFNYADLAAAEKIKNAHDYLDEVIAGQR